MPLSDEEIDEAMRGLSPEQRDIYLFIRAHNLARGIGPTVREIAAAFPGRGMLWFKRQLRAIERAGLIGPGWWSWSRRRAVRGQG